MKIDIDTTTIVLDDSIDEDDLKVLVLSDQVWALEGQNKTGLTVR